MTRQFKEMNDRETTAYYYNRKKNRKKRIAHGPNTPLNFSWGFAGLNTAPGAGGFSNNNAALASSTAWKFQATAAQQAQFAAVLAGAGSPHKAQFDLFSPHGSVSFFVDADGGLSGGVQTFTSTYIGSTGVLTATDVFNLRVTMIP